MSTRIPLALVLCALYATSAAAQPAQESSAAVSRIDTERRCIETQRDRLAGALFRLGNARQAISSGRPGAPEVTEAIRVARQIEIEIRTIGNDIARCANPDAETQPAAASGPSGNAQPVHTVATTVQRTEEGISSERMVAESGTPVARDRVLSAHMKILLAEQLDGQGQLDANVLVQGLAGVAPRVEACYEQLTTRARNVQRGEVQLYFTMLTTRPHPDGMRLAEFTIRDRQFQECVAHAFGQARMSTPASGAPIRYRVRLRFGP